MLDDAITKSPILAVLTAMTAGSPPGVLPSLTRNPVEGLYHSRFFSPTNVAPLANGLLSVNNFWIGVTI